MVYRCIENPWYLWDISNCSSHNNMCITNWRKFSKHSGYKRRFPLPCTSNNSDQTTRWYIYVDIWQCRCIWLQQEKEKRLHMYIYELITRITFRIKNITFESHEKNPFLIEIAGSPGSRGGFGRRSLSSANSRSSRRFKDTLAFTTWKYYI